MNMLWFHFILGSLFYFPLFMCMVMYDNELKTTERKMEIEPRIKLNHNIYMVKFVHTIKLRAAEGSFCCHPTGRVT